MEVLVTVSGKQNGPDGTGAPIEVITAGEYVYKNKKHYLIYEEMVEGTDSVTKNTLRFDEGECMMRRTGALNVQMIFDRNSKTVSTYTTPYGNMVLGISTNELTIMEEESGVRLSIGYELDLNYEYFADCSLTVEARYKKIP